MFAALRGETKMVSKLISSVATLDLQDKQGLTALMKATTNDYYDITTMLIESGRAGIDKQSKEEGYTALMIATVNNNLNGPMKCPATVDALLKAGANIALKSTGTVDGGRTVLHWAALKGRKTILRALLEKASLELVDTQDDLGRTAVMTAVEKNAHDSVEQLFEKGANIITMDRYGESALSIACSYDNPQLVGMIINEGIKRKQLLDLLVRLDWRKTFKALYIYGQYSIGGFMTKLGIGADITTENNKGTKLSRKGKDKEGKDRDL